MTAAAALPFATKQVAPIQPTAAVLQVKELKAYYRTRHFGVEREVRAVDGVTFEVRSNEIYGLAGESSSGKSTLIKAIAAAMRPPLEIVGGTVAFASLSGGKGLHQATSAELAAIRWRKLSYIMQGSMSVLNPVRRVRRSFEDFAARHLGGTGSSFEASVREHSPRQARRQCVNAIRMGLVACASGLRRAATTRPTISSLPTAYNGARRRQQKDVLGMIRSIRRRWAPRFCRHPRSRRHAYVTDRLAIMAPADWWKARRPAVHRRSTPTPGT
jgi:peptide/nickel transport system ATP-binding protein